MKITDPRNFSRRKVPRQIDGWKMIHVLLGPISRAYVSFFAEGSPFDGIFYPSSRVYCVHQPYPMKRKEGISILMTSVGTGSIHRFGPFLNNYTSKEDKVIDTWVVCVKS